MFISFWGTTGLSSPEQIFYGTMQFSKEKNNEQEVIDGQQRLSTLLLLLFILKKMFPEEPELQNMEFLWLSTRVNSGKEQEYLEKILLQEFKYVKKGSNPYQINATLIKNLIEEQIQDKEFNQSKFINHILSNLYFAVIETEAGLSKTLQIFNSINTLGLDLNGANVFKIRIYEYLRDIKKQDETIFENIDKLYRKIKDNNEKFEQEISIDEILQIYQYIIIAKCKLPRTLYTYGTDTFFEQLFDSVLNTNTWEHFKKNTRRLNLSLETLEQIINIRYEWAKSSYETVEDGCAENLIAYSRYSRHLILIFIFLFAFKGQKDYFHNLMQFLHKLSKLYTIYSIRFQKKIGEIDTFTYDLIEKILNANYEKVMSFLTEKIGKLNDHKGWYDLEEILNGNIVYNNKLKNIICRLSAMLHEDYKSKKEEKINEINDNIFNGNVYIDIEHIQSYLDKNLKEREKILNEWGDDINSIGNLMILEYDINRSLQNKDYNIKKTKYKESVFQVVQDQIINYKSWTLKDCKKRKKEEVQKILSYLFT